MPDSLIDKVFGPNGLIAKSHDNYEHRPGQIKMAEEIVRALEEKRHLIVEAGTGTGKTLAYLVPAIAAALASKKRVVISTGTKNLQEQLMEKDIPFLQKVLPKKFSAAYMKGRSNYACLYRISKAEHQPILDGLDEMDHFDEVRRWSMVSKVGDRREPDQRAFRDLPRAKVSRLRAVLHHQDAGTCRGRRHHHRQSSSLLRRPECSWESVRPCDP
jgi:ATP-dependent DNA helicase DinG